jgi:hypothetical protein
MKFRVSWIAMKVGGGLPNVLLSLGASARV